MDVPIPPPVVNQGNIYVYWNLVFSCNLYDGVSSWPRLFPVTVMADKWGLLYSYRHFISNACVPTDAGKCAIGQSCGITAIMEVRVSSFILPISMGGKHDLSDLDHGSDVATRQADLMGISHRAVYLEWGNNEKENSSKGQFNRTKCHVAKRAQGNGQTVRRPPDSHSGILWWTEKNLGMLKKHWTLRRMDYNSRRPHGVPQLSPKNKTRMLAWARDWPCLFTDFRSAQTSLLHLLWALSACRPYKHRMFFFFCHHSV